MLLFNWDNWWRSRKGHGRNKSFDWSPNKGYPDFFRKGLKSSLYISGECMRPTNHPSTTAALRLHTQHKTLTSSPTTTTKVEITRARNAHDALHTPKKQPTSKQFFQARSNHNRWRAPVLSSPAFDFQPTNYSCPPPWTGWTNSLSNTHF
jgi:hypothetical protein